MRWCASIGVALLAGVLAGGDIPGAAAVGQRLEAADRQAAETILGEDPYAKAGLFASTEIRPWNWTFNKPEGI